MAGDSEHPVTLGDLICAERKQGEEGHGPGYFDRRPATVADLVSALRAEGMLVIEKVDGEWPDWAIAGNRYYWSISSVLDALAEAQPFPPAGEPPKDPWDYDP